MKDQKMKAAVLTGYGSSDVVSVKEVSIPQPKTNEILVKVYASAVTRADTMMRTGKPYIGRLFLGLRKPNPDIPGTGFSGKVVKIGSDVQMFKVGDSVFGETTTNFSSNAQYLSIPENGVLLNKPQNLSYEEAAVFTDGHLTSMNFLKNVGKLKPNQKILINGGSGSLGSSAIQLAKVMGAEVTAVCSYRNTGLVKSLGADFVIDYTQQDFTKSDKKFDLVYDTVGKSSYSKVKNILTENGAYISPVLQFSLLVQMLFTSLFSKKKARFEATGMKKEIELKVMLKELVQIYKTGKLKTIIDRQFPLEKVAQAHGYIDTGRKKGNVILINE